MFNRRIIPLLIFLFIFFSTQNAFCCSMFKLTANGQTFVGNNEDYNNPNTRIWFENGGKDQYGAIYDGLDNYWPQGGMNTAGLVFDGFGMDYLEIKDFAGKKQLPGDFLKDILRNFSTVEEVKKYYSQHDLRGFENSMFLYIDKTGKYLVVEGDSLILGNKEAYILSNFYPSQTKDEKDVEIEFYQKGRKFIDTNKGTTIEYCTAVMDTMHQETVWGAGTLYTSVYDLKAGDIYFYYLHDYKQVVKFNLEQELEKGDHEIVMPELFPENKEGLRFFNNYNEVSNELDLLRDADCLSDTIRYKNITNTIFKKNIKLVRVFSEKINETGKMWMDKKEYANAVLVYRISTTITPKYWEAYQNLAEAYYKNKQFKLALTNYQKAVELNPDNKQGKKQIKRLQKQGK